MRVISNGHQRQQPTEGSVPTEPRSRPRVFTLPFVLALIAIASLAGVKAWQNWSLSARVARCEALSKASSAFHMKFSTLSGGQGRRADIEMAFNGGRPIGTRPVKEPWADGVSRSLEEGVLIDSATGGVLRIRFLDGRLWEYGPDLGGIWRAGQPPGWGQGEVLRQWVLIFGPTSWCMGVFVAALI